MTITAFLTALNLVSELPCPPNIYAMVSACGSDEDPTNYDFLFLFYGVEVTSQDIDTLSTMQPDAETNIIESTPAIFRKREKIKQVAAQALSLTALTSMDINDTSFCDSPECSDLCGTESQGCQEGFAVTKGTGGTAVVLHTADGGGTWEAIATPFTTATDDIQAVDCDGEVVVVTNGTNTAYAYSHDGGDTWTEVLTPTKVMNDVFVLGATRVWFVGHDGYIWFSDDRGASIEVQDAGVATAQTLNSVSFADAKRGYAVGNSNAFVYTTDGGDSWVAGTGPSAGNDLKEVAAVPGTKTLFVGDEIGNVYRSKDGGTTWETVFAATAATAGGISGLVAWDCNVIAFTANDLDPYWYADDSDGVMFRSIDGGASWLQIDVSANDGLNTLAQCEINKYWTFGDGAFGAKVAGIGI
jgi:photosystem II stability/assembly factor-like uncharacterized protein